MLGLGPCAPKIALVNNMPDAAFDATERQFVDLVRSTSGADIDISLYGLPGIERGAAAQASLKHRYRPLEEIWDDPPDALIITGTEPVASDVTTEPYWDSLAKLIVWAEHATFSTMLSCLAAHAALLIFDGIERQPLPEKCSGVFENDVRHPHPLLHGLGDRAVVPQSRLNDVPTARLHASGYTTLLRSGEAGWTVAVKRRGRCLFVLCQGHLEYGTETLLREIVATCDGSSPASASRTHRCPSGISMPTARSALWRFGQASSRGRPDTAKRISRTRRSWPAWRTGGNSLLDDSRPIGCGMSPLGRRRFARERVWS